MDSSGNKIYMTPRGFNALQKELKQLKSVDRPAIIKDIAAARELGDLSENAEYHYAREKQGAIESRIAEIEGKLSRAEVIDASKLSGDDVKFGATVRLSDLDNAGSGVQYTIVGIDEADVTKGYISLTSPLARTLISKKIGDVVEVLTPGGRKSFELISIEYSQNDEQLA
ncbi:MAG: transcription elongation factor GreA [Holosporales bacterium]|jgi:transcription elongation factor GreA|nr:transcription elongation factor GreA [Holosporales bacterium]